MGFLFLDKEKKMSEETKVVEPSEPAGGAGVENLAKSIGWNPDYQGEDAKSASEFIVDSKDIMTGMSKKLRSQGRTIGELKYALDEVASHNKAVYQAEVSRLKRELMSLKESRKDAVEEGNNKKVEMIDSQIREINQVPAAQKAQPQLPQEFHDWHEANPWYATDVELTAYADTYNNQMNASDPEFAALPLPKKLKRVEATVKKIFSEKFNGRPSAPAGGVESGGKKTKTGKSYSLSDLPTELQRTAKIFERQGVMSVKDYISDLKKQGVLS